MNRARAAESVRKRLDDALRRVTARPDTPTDPSATMFARIRANLTLWYAGVVLAALLLFGGVLYATVNKALFDAVNSRLQANAYTLGESCARSLGLLGGFGAFPGAFTARQNSLWACFGPDDSVLQTSIPAQGTGFMSAAQARAAAQSGTPILDMVDLGGSIGEVQRYTAALTDQSGHVAVIIQVGLPVDAELQSLHILLVTLLALGVGALIVATAGGLLLSRRALMPARVAFNRQQAFIADASHELRAPLTMLRADAEVLLRGRERFSADDAALLEDIVSEVGHMATLTNTMLTMARIDSGGARPDRDVVELADVAQAVARRATAFALERGVTVSVEREGPALVIGDRVLLEQAAIVLVDNAIKYNQTGGTVALRTATAGERAILEVRDSGIGIAPEHMPHLGERFYRVDKARSRENGGAGLGLSIARGIAAQLGGSLSLSSQPERGTIATLTFPAARLAARATPAQV